MTISMMAMEQELKSDSNGTFLENLKMRIAQYERYLKREMDRGLAPAAFRNTRHLLDALETSQLVLEEVWQDSHYANEHHFF